MVGGGEPGDDRRGAGAEPAGERDLTGDPEGDAVRRVQRLEGAYDEVLAVRGHVEAARLDRELAALLDLELEGQSETAAAITS